MLSLILPRFFVFLYDHEAHPTRWSLLLLGLRVVAAVVEGVRNTCKLPLTLRAPCKPQLLTHPRNPPLPHTGPVQDPLSLSHPSAVTG